MEGIRETLHRYRVDFDTYFLEGSLHEGDPSPIAVAFDRLREQGHLYESEGALWLRTTEFGDDKDRVLKRQTGAPTYFAADVAYQEDKFLRGFDRAIYVLGADHHGYIARLKAIASSLGEDPDRVEIPILQFVHIVEGGGRAKMSKRRGDFVTLDELIERIGVDATRWFMLSALARLDDRPRRRARRQAGPREPGLLRAVRCTRGSPSILRNLDDAQLEAALGADAGGVTLNDSERELIRTAARVPERDARGGRAARAAPDRDLRARARAGVRRLLPRLAGAQGARRGAARFRIGLCVATQRTLAGALGLLGVSAPESM